MPAEIMMICGAEYHAAIDRMVHEIYAQYYHVVTDDISPTTIHRYGRSEMFLNEAVNATSLYDYDLRPVYVWQYQRRLHDQGVRKVVFKNRVNHLCDARVNKRKRYIKQLKRRV